MRRVLGLLMICGTAFPSTGSAQDPAIQRMESEQPEGISATYRATISERQVRDWIQFSESSSSGASSNEAVRQMLLSSALADEARRLGLDAQPSTKIELDRARFRQLNPLLRKAVAAEAKSDFTEQQVESRYLQIKDTYARPERRRLRNIFKRYPPNADDAAKLAIQNAMLTIRSRVLAGERFAELAAAESDSQTRLQGGLLGNVRPGTLRPRVDEVAMAMKAGEISEVIAGDDGLTILYCEQVLDAVIRTPEELRDVARGQLKKAAFQQRWALLREDLVARADVEVAWQLLGGDEPLNPEANLVTLKLGNPIGHSGDGGSSTVAEVEAILGQAVELRAASREQIRSKVSTYWLQKMSVREALARGLHESIPVERRWFWQRQQILSALALAYLIEDRLEPVTTEEMRTYFQQFQSEFQRAAHFQLTLIALATEGRDLRRVYELGAEIQQDIQRGDLTLQEAARRYSAHPSASAGGASGWVSRIAIPKRFGIDFLRELKRLKPGQQSQWVLSEDYLWLFRLEAVQEPRRMTFDEARPRLEHSVGSHKVAVLREEILVELWERLDVRSRVGTGDKTSSGH